MNELRTMQLITSLFSGKNFSNFLFLNVLYSFHFNHAMNGFKMKKLVNIIYSLKVRKKTVKFKLHDLFVNIIKGQYFKRLNLSFISFSIEYPKNIFSGGSY